MSCDYRFKSGKVCPNKKIIGSNFCHLEEHYPNKIDYQNILTQKMNEFISNNENSSNYTIKEVHSDGACLYRCLSNAIFINNSKDLNKVKELFEGIGYFEGDNFLGEYLDIAECFTAEDYNLDDEIEEEIARALQLIILNYVKNHAKDKIMVDMTLEDLIMLCHEIDLETYIDNYGRFAGDDDFILEKTVNENGKMKIKKVNIDNRWGGIPELKVFCVLFNFNLEIYVSQKFNKNTMKPENTSKVKENVYFKIFDKIESGKEKPKIFKLLFREFKSGNHYDFLEIKN